VTSEYADYAEDRDEEDEEEDEIMVSPEPYNSFVRI